MFNYITILVLFIIIAVWGVRFLNQSGLIMPDNKIFSWMTVEQKTFKGEKVDRNDITKVLIWAFGIRLVLYIYSALYVCFSMDSETAYTFQSFLDSWQRWDSSNYLDLARQGYSNCIVEGQHLFLVFFPLYPFLIHLMHYVINNYQIAALLVSTLCYCVGSCYLYALVSEEYGKAIAKKALLYISIFPFSFFFGGMMTESLFFCTTVVAFYYIKHHKWLVVGIIGCLSSLTRLHGMLLIGVAGIEFFTYYKPFQMIKDKKAKELVILILKKGVCLLLIPVGTLIYLYINYKVDGDYFRFMVFQKEHWGHENTYFANAVKEIFQNVFTSGEIGMLRTSIWIPEILLFILAVALIIYGIRRHNLLYTAYLLVYTILNYSITWLISGSRYMLCALPLFVILAEFGEGHKKADKLIAIISVIGLGFYLAGYLMYKQIM